MILHTALTAGQVGRALRHAREAGLVTPDVTFTRFTERGSRTHDRAIDVQLGTHDKASLPHGTRDQYGRLMHVRRYKNSGSHGASSEQSGCPVWAATWHEWGWFIANVLAADPRARFAPNYDGFTDFHVKTDGAFTVPQPPFSNDAERLTWIQASAAEDLRNGHGLASMVQPPPREHEGQLGNPDYVSPALQAAREQLASSQEFLDHIDTIVFGPRQ